MMFFFKNMLSTLLWLLALVFFFHGFFNEGIIIYNYIWKYDMRAILVIQITLVYVAVVLKKCIANECFGVQYLCLLYHAVSAIQLPKK